MKNWTYLLLFMAVSLVAISCGDDDDPTAQLRYDGDNETAPFLPNARYVAAARFTADELVNNLNRKLSSVDYYMYETPAEADLVIYRGTTNDAPGAQVYSADITSEINNNQWNTHTLNTPIELTDTEDLWITIELTHLSNIQSIGCDAGPRDPYGDYLFDSQDGAWSTFNARTGESINWNIRGNIVD